jgi:hypothetical protein
MICKHYFTCMDCNTKFIIVTVDEDYSNLIGASAETLPNCPECLSNNTNMDDVREVLE